MVPASTIPIAKNHQPIHRLLGNNHQRIGSKPSGSKHHQPLDHVLEQTDRPSPTPWRVSFVILFKIYFPKFEGIKFLKLSEVKMENENPLLEYALTKRKRFTTSCIHIFRIIHTLVEVRSKICQRKFQSFLFAKVGGKRTQYTSSTYRLSCELHNT